VGPKNLNVPMANASQYNGNVIDKMTVVMVQMRLSVLELVEV